MTFAEVTFTVDLAGVPQWAWIVIASVIGTFVYPIIGGGLAGLMRRWGWTSDFDKDAGPFLAATFWPLVMLFLTIMLPAVKTYRITRGK